MNECNIAKDLMLLCADSQGSTDSQEFIRRHTAACDNCRAVWDRMRQPLPDAPEVRAAGYRKPLRWGLFRVIAVTVLASILGLGIFGYLYWELGFLGREEIIESPVNGHMFRIKYFDNDGLFISGGASVVRPNGTDRNLRGDKTFIDLHIHWAPDGNAYFAWWEFTDHNEAYFVDYRDIEAAGGWKNYLDARDLYSEDFFADLTKLCREAGIESMNFVFKEWSEDGLRAAFTFEQPGGKIGTVWYSLEKAQVIELIP